MRVSERQLFIELLEKMHIMPDMLTQKSLALFGFLILISCSRGGPGGFFSDGKISVSVEKVLAEEKQATISLPATLIPSEKIEIQFPMDVKIERVAVNLGDTVNQGDLLFLLNEQDFNLKLAQLKAQKMEQEALLEKNTYFFKNRDRLLEEGKIDKSLHEALESEVKVSEAQVEKSRADVAIIENQVRQLNILAPFSGLVTEKNIANGVLALARKSLITLVKPDPTHVSFQLSSADATAADKGMDIHVRVDDYAIQNLKATVVFIGPELEAATRTFEVRATLANPKHLFKGGMAAQVYFTSSQKVKVLSIPSRAVLTDNDRDYVYIVRQNKAWRVRIYIRKNIDNPELTEVLEGLTDTDMVVVESQGELKEGAEVNLWR